MPKCMNQILHDKDSSNNNFTANNSYRDTNCKLSNNGSYSKPMATSSYLPNNYNKQIYNENSSFNSLLS